MGCNAACSCVRDQYDPVCGADGVMYYSPCHAGCTSINSTELSSGKQVQDSLFQLCLQGNASDEAASCSRCFLLCSDARLYSRCTPAAAASWGTFPGAGRVSLRRGSAAAPATTWGPSSPSSSSSSASPSSAASLLSLPRSGTTRSHLFYYSAAGGALHLSAAMHRFLDFMFYFILL